MLAQPLLRNKEQRYVLRCSALILVDFPPPRRAESNFGRRTGRRLGGSESTQEPTVASMSTGLSALLQAQ